MVTLAELSGEILSDPVLLFLYHRAEQILGIRAAPEALVKLKDYLEKRCGASYMDAPAEYERILSSKEEVFIIAEMLTINETYFFREELHFSLLMRYFLPRLAKYGRPIRVCSAATSNGCEAYSLAMLMDFYGQGKDVGAADGGESAQPFSFEIDAFDIDRSVIETAQLGRYTSNTRRDDGGSWKFLLDNYLVADGEEYVVPPALKRKVHFFTHNIMDGLKDRYDIIFFRNAMIYFSDENRRRLLDILADALVDGGLLFLGVSEVSSVEHPLLANKCTMDAFYFQKLGVKQADAVRTVHSGEQDRVDVTKTVTSIKAPHEKTAKAPPKAAPKRSAHTAAKLPAQQTEGLQQTKGLQDVHSIAAILDHEEGAPNARKILETLGTGEEKSLSVNELVAAAIHFLGGGDFSAADAVLFRLEKIDRSAFIDFLRGEFHYLGSKTEEAEAKFKEAAGADKAFWPAFYRMSSLADKNNRTLYEYKIKNALESIELGKDLHYESFIGGFSPDYYRQILEKKLAGRVSAKGYSNDV
jgi:chemotaxis protein methyltransferase CheR